MRTLLLAITVLCGCLHALAQERVAHHANVTIAGGSYRGSLSLAYWRNWQLGQKQKIGIGIGLRGTSTVATDQYFITAPAKLTSESHSLLIFFKENIKENIDSLLLNNAQVNMMNIMINIDYRISKKIVLGFNIDALGFSFGKSQKSNFISGPSGKVTTGDPTHLNVLLISDNDRGSLNSELYAHYYFKPQWALKLGGQFLFTEYTTETKVQQIPEPNDRFRNKSLLLSLGVTRKF